MFGTVDILKSVLHKEENFYFRWSKTKASCQEVMCAADARWSLVDATRI